MQIQSFHNMISFLRRSSALLTNLFIFASPNLADQPGPSPVKIFILAGQSNMAGTGVIEDAAVPGTLENLVANDPEYAFLPAPAYGHTRLLSYPFPCAFSSPPSGYSSLSALPPTTSAPGRSR